MAKHKVVRVDWVDSCGCGSWHSKKERVTASRCVSVGLLIRRDQDIVLTQSMDLDNGNDNYTIAIPARAVVKLKVLGTIET